MSRMSELKKSDPRLANIKDDVLAGFVYDKNPKFAKIDRQIFIDDAIEDKSFIGKVKSVFTDTEFVPSVGPVPTIVTEAIPKIPRTIENLQAKVLRKGLGLDIPERLESVEETSPLDFVSTQREIPKAIEERFPDIPLEEAVKGRQPGAVFAGQALKEPFKEVADLIGFALRPEQLLVVGPAINVAFRALGFVGKEAFKGVRDIVRLIKRSGVKEGDAVESIVEKVSGQVAKETNIPKAEIEKEILTESNKVKIVPILEGAIKKLPEEERLNKVPVDQLIKFMMAKVQNIANTHHTESFDVIMSRIEKANSLFSEKVKFTNKEKAAFFRYDDILGSSEIDRILSPADAKKFRRWTSEQLGEPKLIKNIQEEGVLKGEGKAFRPPETQPKPFKKEIRPLEEVAEEIEAKARGEAAKEGPFDKIFERIGKKLRSEAKGQEILDGLAKKGVSPNTVASNFWDNTWKLLNNKQKKIIEDHVFANTQFKIGETLGFDKNNRRIIAKTQRDISDNVIEFSDDVEELEGVQRGLIALMEFANQNIGVKGVVKKVISPKVQIIKPNESAKIEGNNITAVISPSAKESGKGFQLTLFDRNFKPMSDSQFATFDEAFSTAKKVTKEPLAEQAKPRLPFKTQGGKTVGRIAEETPQDVSNAINPAFSPEQRVGIKIDPIVQEGAVPKKIVSKADIIKFMSEKMDIPIRIGRFRTKALGIFKAKPEIIRTKLADDIPVAAHELGHFLEKSLFGTTKLDGHGLSGKSFRPFSDELSKLATPANAASSVESEGFAEFVSLFVVDKAKAQKAAPKFYKWFVDDILENQHPQVKEVLNQISDDFGRWMRQSSVAKVMGQIAFGDKGSFKLPSPSKVYTAGKDKFYPIQMAVKAINPDVAISENPYMLSRLYSDWIGEAEQFLKFGQINTKPGKFKIGQKIGPSFEEILAPIRTEHREFSSFLVAKRAVELSGRGKMTGISLGDAQQALKELSTPAFQKAAKELDIFQDRFAQRMLDAGFFTNADYLKFKKMNKDYVPFFRIAETETNGTGGAISNVFNPIKKLSREGSTRQIVDPLESIVKNVYTFTALAKKQEIKKAIAGLAKFDKSGKYIERVPREFKSVAISNDELYKIFRDFSNWTERTEFKEFKKEFSKKTGIKDGEVSKPIEKLESIIIDALKKRGMTEGEGKAFVSRLKNAKGAKEIDSAVETVIEKQTILHTVKQMDLDLPEWVTIFRPKESLPQGPFIEVFNKGKKTLFQLDPELHKAFTGLDIESVNFIVRAASIPARLLRAGATLTPEFSLKNILRDPFSAFVFSKDGFIPGIDTAKGFFHAFRQDKLYQAWRVGGGGHSMMVSLDRDVLQKNLKQLLNDVTVSGKVKNIVNHPMDTLRIMSELFESSNRLGNFSKTYKNFNKNIQKAIKFSETAPKTLNKKKPFVEFKISGKMRKVENTKESLRRFAIQLEKERLPGAAFEAREVTLDFSKIGSKMKAMNQLTAFFNARLEGYDKFIRVFKERPVTAMAKAMSAVTLPTMYLWWANKDDPRYQELPRWEKALFWHVLTDKHIYRIPKPFELGFLFGTIPQAFLEWMDKKDPEGVKRLFEDINRDAINTVLPTSAKLAFEQLSGDSLFTGAPLVGRAEENLAPPYQSRPWTSETAKLVGKVLNYSPAKIDALVFGFTGGLGRLAIKEGADRAVLQFIDEPIDPSPTFSDIPILKTFTSRWPRADADSIQLFYKKYGKAKEAQNTFISLVKAGEAKLAKTYSEENQPLIQQAVGMELTRNMLADGHKIIRIINENKNMTPAQKRKKIDETYLFMTKAARRGLATNIK